MRIRHFKEQNKPVKLMTRDGKNIEYFVSFQEGPVDFAPLARLLVMPMKDNKFYRGLGGDNTQTTARLYG